MTDDELVALYARASADHFKECHGCGGGAHKAGLRAIQHAVRPEVDATDRIRAALKRLQFKNGDLYINGHNVGGYWNKHVQDLINEVEAAFSPLAPTKCPHCGSEKGKICNWTQDHFKLPPCKEKP